MRAIICLILIIVGGYGIYSILLEATKPAEMVNAYDSGGMNFIVAVLVFLTGLVILFVGGDANKRQPAKLEPPPQAPEAPSNPRRDGIVAEGETLLAAARDRLQLSDFEGAAERFKQALVLTPPQDEIKVAEINARLGWVYLLKARETRSLSDIENSIAAYLVTSKCLASKDTWPIYPIIRYEIGEAYWLKWEVTGDLVDLQSSSQSYAMSVSTLPKRRDRVAFGRYQQRYGNTLRLLAAELDDPTLLRVAELRLLEAVQLSPPETAPSVWVLAMEQLALTREAMAVAGLEPEQKRREAIKNLEAVARYLPKLSLEPAAARVNEHRARMGNAAAKLAHTDAQQSFP